VTPFRNSSLGLSAPGPSSTKGSPRPRKKLASTLFSSVLVSAAGVAALTSSASAAVTVSYYYRGTISQQNHSGFFDMYLTRNSSGEGYQLSARWRPVFSPAECSDAFLFTPQTVLTANVQLQTVIPQVETKLEVKEGVATGNYEKSLVHAHMVENFTAVFTKGKVTGSFTNDTYIFHSARKTASGSPLISTTCSTGPITFIASRTSSFA